MRFRNLLQLGGLAAILAIGCGNSVSTEKISDSGINDLAIKQKYDMKLMHYRDPEADKTGYVKEIIPAEFDYEVLQAVPPVAVDFTAKNCSPCYQMKPIFEHYAKRYVGMKFVSFDIGQDYKGEKSIFEKYLDIKKHGKIVPVFSFFNRGDHYPAYQVKGARKDELESSIVNFLKQCSIDGGIADAGPIPDMMKMDLAHVLSSPEKD